VGTPPFESRREAKLEQAGLRWHRSLAGHDPRHTVSVETFMVLTEKRIIPGKDFLLSYSLASTEHRMHLMCDAIDASVAATQ
jgi:hypothetical protein